MSLPRATSPTGFTLTAPAISQHLKVLREAGLVRVRTEAQRRIYELDPNGLAELDKWLGAIRQSWRGPSPRRNGGLSSAATAKQVRGTETGRDGTRDFAWRIFLSANRRPPRIKLGAGIRRNMR